MRLGLRAQIVLSLTLLLLVSAPLLVTVTLRLSRHATALQRQHGALQTASALRASLALLPPTEGAVRQRQLTALGAGAGLLGLRLRTPEGKGHVVGVVRGPASASLPLDDGSTLGIWLPPDDGEATRGLQRMLIFYVALTWLAAIVLAYVLLTLLIVRPLEQAVRSARSLAGGRDEVRLPEDGPAEVHRLATSFNDMANQLRVQRTRLEQRLAQLQATTEELSSTQQRLVHGEKLATVGRMAAGVAHEIGNPLAAILGMVELLRGQDLPAQEQAEFLARVQAETERIHEIIRDLLDFSRRDGGTDGADESANIAAVIDDAVALVAPQPRAREVRLQTVVAPGLPRVVGAQTRLTQVLVNLLLNAADAIGGAGTVSVSACADDDGVRLRVQDDGPGIADDMLPHLFEPFATSKAVGQGTGLGLAVCHSLVEGMGGTITATNCDAGGARFELTLRAVD